MSGASNLSAPDFGVLLQDSIASVAPTTMPALLAALERGAAERYREWASQDEANRAGLLECSEREDEIARRIDEAFPVEAAERGRVDAALPGAREIYLGVFEGLPLLDQFRIQADAERQGAAAWRGLAAGSDDASRVEVLEGCATLEEENAAFLEGVVGARSA